MHKVTSLHTSLHAQLIMVTLYEQVDQVINHRNLGFHLTRTLTLLFGRFHLSFSAKVTYDIRWWALSLLTKFSISWSILSALGLLPDSSIVFSFSIMASTF